MQERERESVRKHMFCLFVETHILIIVVDSVTTAHNHNSAAAAAAAAFRTNVEIGQPFDISIIIILDQNLVPAKKRRAWHNQWWLVGISHDKFF